MGERPDAESTCRHLRQVILDELVDHPDVEGHAAEEHVAEAAELLDDAAEDVLTGKLNK